MKVFVIVALKGNVTWQFISGPKCIKCCYTNYSITQSDFLPNIFPALPEGSSWNLKKYILDYSLYILSRIMVQY